MSGGTVVTITQNGPSTRYGSCTKTFWNSENENNREKNYDLMLMINGCDSECSKPSEVIDNLVIDHNNWENAIEVFAEKRGW